MTDKSIGTINSGSLTRAAVAGRKLLHGNAAHSPAWVMLCKLQPWSALHSLQQSLTRAPSGSSAHLVWVSSEVLTAYVIWGRGQPYPSGQFLGLPDKVFMNLPLELPES